jgi:hypothetical protein
VPFPGRIGRIWRGACCHDVATASRAGLVTERELARRAAAQAGVDPPPRVPGPRRRAQCKQGGDEPNTSRRAQHEQRGARRSGAGLAEHSRRGLLT